MTGSAADDQRTIPDHGMPPGFEVFAVQFDGHPHHYTCYFLFGFGVAGIIQPVRPFLSGMAETASYPQPVFKIIDHDALERF
jgi:hypothetical protein